MALVCQRCGKVQATVHLTDILNGEKRERHLCGDCAEQEGVVIKSGSAPLTEILSKFVTQKAYVQELADLTCTHCGLKFVEFRSNGMLGCPHDYDAFQRALEPLIERAHEGAVQHVGKMPPRTPVPFKSQIDLVRLRRELQQAVEREEYELAARLRDEISTAETDEVN